MAEGAGHGQIVFVGMMGSGKTTVGRRVAKLLGREFIDTDARIVAESGCEVDAWFADRGEDAFRDVEERTIATLLDRDEPAVIATGGGAVVRRATRERLCTPDVAVIWLRASPEFLCSRLEHKGDHRSRPLLAGGTTAALVRLDVERRDRYAEVADVIIDIEPVMNDADKPRKALASLVVDTLGMIESVTR